MPLPDLSSALRSFQQALDDGQIALSPGSLDAQLFVHLDRPNGELRLTYVRLETEEQAFKVYENGKLRAYRADATTVVAGRDVAVDAKYVDDWASSPRNPANDRPFLRNVDGTMSMDQQERANMLDQARRYSETFDGGAVYHTNSVDLASAWSRIFHDAGLNNIRFVITPAVKK